VLGVVQGLTELLPISSSGHLVLVGHGLGIRSQGVMVEVVLHLGTLLAVVWAFRATLLEMIRGIAGRDAAGRRLVGRLALATLPVVVLGPLLEGPVHAAFESPRFAATMLLATGLILLATRLARVSGRTLRWPDALAMGFAQVLALLPGISRSGVTIAAGFGRGLDRVEAARFSFLMSIPAVLGAAVFEAMELGGSWPRDVDVVGLALGFVAAFVAGLVAIHVLFKLIDRRRFVWFGIYCLCAGVVGLLILGRA
jgi:undecaprenyl-diphosphatase